MTLAFVLLRVELGKEPEVIQELLDINEVIESYLVYGIYDVVARVKVGNLEELEYVIDNKIRKIRGVRSTYTLITTQ
jgi:Lrp/AsnC family transcriptional regulator for asnA, asnC and gidA